MISQLAKNLDLRKRKSLKEKYGKDYFKKKKLKNELSQVNNEMRRLKKQLKSLEEKKVDLLESIG